MGLGDAFDCTSWDYEDWTSWKPELRNGYGPLQITAEGVSLIGQAGVVLGQETCQSPAGDGNYRSVGGPAAKPMVLLEGVSFDSIHFPPGVSIAGGSLAMTNCTSTGEEIRVDRQTLSARVCRRDASLVMEDCLVYDSRYHGVVCEGKTTATRCTFQHNGGSGVVVGRNLWAGRDLSETSGELVDCVISENGWEGTKKAMAWP